MVTPASAGVLTSRMTSLPLAMVTFSPAAGTLRSGQVAGSDQRLAAVPAFWACARLNRLPSRHAGNSETSRTERQVLRMASAPNLIVRRGVFAPENNAIAGAGHIRWRASVDRPGNATTPETKKPPAMAGRGL